MRVLVTGAAGFIGHHIVQTMAEAGHEVICLDRIDSTSTLERLKGIKGARTIWHDLRSPINELLGKMIGPVDYIYHLAASTHVDRSIQNSMEFVFDNVVGTANLLEFARTLPDLKLLVNFSTDEVYGPAPDGIEYKETDRFDARNPYSATKAAAVDLVHAYANTYGLPCLTTFCMNAFGEGQHPEKFLPFVIRSLILGETVPIHIDPRDNKDIANIMLDIMEKLAKGKEVPDRMNIPGVKEVDNLAMAQAIAKAADMYLNYELVDFHSTRPGHDLRYALEGSVLKAHGLDNYTSFEASMKRTVTWYLENREWLML